MPVIAVPKGRMLDSALDFLYSQGLWRGAEVSDRALRVDDGDGNTLLLARAQDVALFVEHGAADLGIVGQDTLREAEPNVIPLGGLGFGTCRMILAGREGTVWPTDGPVRLATKYPNIARAFCEEQNLEASIVTLHGSVELAPHTGIADYVIDITQTGRTLKENNLKVFRTLFTSQAALIASPRTTVWQELQLPVERSDERVICGL